MSVDYAVTASARGFQIRDALVALFKAEAVPGGALAPVVDIRPSAQFAGDTPAIAVQLMSVKPSEFAQRRRKVIVSIDVIVAAKSTQTDARLANLDDATAALEPLVDDGNGNGIVAILNRPENFNLGGLASETLSGDLDFPYQIREGEQQEVWAYAVMHFQATTYTTF